MNECPCRRQSASKRWEVFLNHQGKVNYVPSSVPSVWVYGMGGRPPLNNCT